MINKKLFLYHVALRGKTCKEIATEIGISPVTLSNKLNGKSDFTLTEIRDLCKALELSESEMANVFHINWTMLSNKKLGNRFEEGLCNYLSNYGFWTSRFQQATDGQPVDIIAVKENRAFLIDCKTCFSGKFSYKRIEPNQQRAMDRFMSFGRNTGAYFALWFNKSEIWLVPFSSMLNKTITLKNITECGGVPLKEWAEKGWSE